MDVYSCNSSNQYLTMHGLWPNNNDGSYPCYCSSEAFDINAVQPIIGNMTQYWPSLNGGNQDFWSHEWTKHGTCAGYSGQLEYFSSALAVRQQWDPIAALASVGIVPSNTQGFTLSQMQNAMTQAYGAYGVVSCDSNGNIQASGVCVDKNLNIMPCPSNVKNVCTASTLYFPSSMS